MCSESTRSNRAPESIFTRSCGAGSGSCQLGGMESLVITAADNLMIDIAAASSRSGHNFTFMIILRSVRSRLAANIKHNRQRPDGDRTVEPQSKIMQQQAHRLLKPPQFHSLLTEESASQYCLNGNCAIDLYLTNLNKCVYAVMLYMDQGHQLFGKTHQGLRIFSFGYA